MERSPAKAMSLIPSFERSYIVGRLAEATPEGGWSDEMTFYHAGIKNSYPTLAEVAPGDFRCVWDSGTADTPRTHIHFGNLKLEP